MRTDDSVITPTQLYDSAHTPANLLPANASPWFPFPGTGRQHVAIRLTVSERYMPNPYHLPSMPTALSVMSRIRHDGYTRAQKLLLVEVKHGMCPLDDCYVPNSRGLGMMQLQPVALKGPLGIFE